MLGPHYKKGRGKSYQDYLEEYQKKEKKDEGRDIASDKISDYFFKNRR